MKFKPGDIIIYAHNSILYRVVSIITKHDCYCSDVPTCWNPQPVYKLVAIIDGYIKHYCEPIEHADDWAKLYDTTRTDRE